MSGRAASDRAMNLRIAGGEVLGEDGMAPGTLWLAGGRIGGPDPAAATLDATGLLVLPGIVDLHGDAFERQLQPRPGVDMPVDVALADTEAQLLANGITTAFHGLTLSWEAGLRGAAAWRRWLDALAARRPIAACDMRVHLRWEAFNLPALDDAVADIAAGRVHLLAFNDHTPSIMRRLPDPVQAHTYSKRSGLEPEAFAALAHAAHARGHEVPAAQARIAAAGRAAGLPMASHDDDTPATRDAFRAMGARICEFPMTEAVARAARAAGDWIAMGSPNVLRGGSHLGWAGAADMVMAGLCDVLTSDYYYPALLQAPFVLAARGLPFARAWATVSANPARAAGLDGRGTLAPGARADIVLVAPGSSSGSASGLAPRVVATIAAGRLAFLGREGAERLSGVQNADDRAVMPIL